MSLLDKIQDVINKSNEMVKTFPEKYREVIWSLNLQEALIKIVNEDLTNNNPDIIFEDYREYFASKSFPTKKIGTEMVFFRGRIGNEVIYGSDDDLNKHFILPYYKHEIEAPPSIYAQGGRFNRQGISYLYLADTIETCLAEVHLQVGQNCSIGEFKCKGNIELIDLTDKDTVEMETWLKLLTQPVQQENLHLYNVTRFLSDVLKSINGNGIYFESVQAEGHNIVCFNPSLFQLVEYSEKIYTTTKIKYHYHQVEDSVREYAKISKGDEPNSYNEYENEKKEKKFDYFNDWIKYEREKINKGVL